MVLLDPDCTARSMYLASDGTGRLPKSGPLPDFACHTGLAYFEYRTHPPLRRLGHLSGLGDHRMDAHRPCPLRRFSPVRECLGLFLAPFMKE